MSEMDKNDHRRLGVDMDLFHIQEEAAGSVFWHKKGWTLFRTIENYIRNRLEQANYQEVRTPILYSSRTLWEKSGHWEKFHEAMFSTGDFYHEPVTDRELVTATAVLKPMSCPPHIEIFKSGTVSYRDLPMRMAEFGTCFRNEASGALHGIMRLRQFTQDDGHIFCTEEQVLDETRRFCDLMMHSYKDFGFTDIKIGISTRPDIRAGDDETWDRAEKALMDAVTACGLSYEIYPGQGAFYGVKLEAALVDLHGREWQCGTLQLDFILANRLGAFYTAKDGSRQNPVILHRAVFGSLERFIGVLLEHHQGMLPLWLRPVQTTIISIKPEQVEAVEAVAVRLKAAGVRVAIDTDDENISTKVKRALESGSGYVLAIGKREVETDSVAVRAPGETKQVVMSIDAALDELKRTCFL